MMGAANFTPSHTVAQTSVVTQHIEASETFDGSVHHGLDVCSDRNVALYE